MPALAIHGIFRATGTDLAARSRMKTLIALAIAAGTTLAAAPTWASCRIHNDTGFDFKVESGNTSNQSVGAHTTTSIAAGKIRAVDEKSGKSVGGSCKDGESVEITDDHGTPVLSVK